MLVASAVAMAGVSRFEDLYAWKLSVQLRNLIYRMTDRGSVTRDFTFRDQIRDSAASASRNLAEGFGRFNPREFAQYTRWAKASHMETRNHLLHGEEAQYFRGDDLKKALRLCKRALGATQGLHRYLMSCNGRLPWDTHEHRTTHRQHTEAGPEPAPRTRTRTQGTSEPQEP